MREMIEKLHDLNREHEMNKEQASQARAVELVCWFDSQTYLQDKYIIQTLKSCLTPTLRKVATFYWNLTFF